MLDKVVGFELRGDEFYVNNVEPIQLYRFMHQAVLDNHIPITKPIGFYLNTPLNISVTTATDRNIYCLENMFALSNNLDFVVTHCSSNIMVVEPTYDVVTTKETDWLSSGKKVSVLGEDKVVYTPCDLTGITVWVLRSSGYAAMKVTSEVMANTKFFPMCTVFSLSDYIKVLPFNGKVRLKLSNGLTEEMLRELLLRWLGDVSGDGLRLEEKEWLSKFMEC